jgi:hypothetical protein
VAYTADGEALDPSKRLRKKSDVVRVLKEFGVKPRRKYSKINRGFSRLRKNSIGVSVLKGRGFRPRRKCHEISGGFSR